MTDLIAELAEVVRLQRLVDATYGCECENAMEDRDNAAVNFLRTHHAEIADMANELRVARESFKRCDEICKCTAEGWRTAEEDMAKRLEAAERDASPRRCKACGRATRSVCDGLDGNGLGCTNAPPIDIAAAAPSKPEDAA